MDHYVVGKSVPDKMLYKGEEFTNPMDVPLLNQMDEPRLYNGCEVTSLAMMLHYHGINVSKNKLAEEISRVPLTYSNGMKGNPNLGFVGDMENGPGLSAYHGPVVKLAKRYVGDRAQDVTGSNPSELYEYVNQGMPVWIITTTRFQPVSNFRTWLTPQGAIDVTFSVHSVVITGYTDDSVYINNPYGKKNQKVNRSQFEKAFKQMGSQAIVIQR
ncbi:C39 family peptidase [Pontibacillus sp. HN14]|uniref:C39 family peptidase n=1 Tax=Pontibacillus TaxID=289201 RepID=UPI00351CBE7B